MGATELDQLYLRPRDYLLELPCPQVSAQNKMERAAGEGCSEVKKVLKKESGMGLGNQRESKIRLLPLSSQLLRSKGAGRSACERAAVTPGPAQVCPREKQKAKDPIRPQSCIAGGVQGVRGAGLTLHSGPEALQVPAAPRLYGLGAPRGIPPHI